MAFLLGKIAWAKLTLLLNGMGYLTVAGTLALEQLCDIYADILQLETLLRLKVGHTPQKHNQGIF